MEHSRRRLIMELGDDMLVDSLETCIRRFVAASGVGRTVEVAGALVFDSGYRDAVANHVELLEATEGIEVERTIREVISWFSRRRREFTWMVIPRRTPELGARLEAAGCGPGEDLIGMVTTDFGLPIPVNPEIAIREAHRDELPRLSRWVARELGWSDSVAGLLLEILTAIAPGFDRRVYLASLGGEPVGFGHLFRLAGDPVAWLRFTATRAEARRRGVYRSLVAQRLADARADGAAAVAVHATPGTSAPICARLGFRELCRLSFYEWRLERG